MPKALVAVVLVVVQLVLARQPAVPAAVRKASTEANPLRHAGKDWVP